MSNRRSKITTKKEYKKEKALLLLTLSYIEHFIEETNIKISLNECKTKYDITIYKIFRWLKNIKKTFVTKKIMNFVNKRMNVMYKKYYSDKEPPQEDLLNISILYFLMFLELNKQNSIDIFIPPVKIKEVKELLDWYNEDNEIPKESLVFFYRTLLTIDPTKESVILLQSTIGTTYGNIKYEEIKGE